MKTTSVFRSVLSAHRDAVQHCAAHLAEHGLDQDPDAIALTAMELARVFDAPAPIAHVALDSALSRLVPCTPPERPSTAIVATEADQAHLRALPIVCWNCDATAWWRAQVTTARWHCARCSPPDHDDAIAWHDATEPELEDAKREPRWTETPDQDDYVLLRIRKLAREAARTAADFLGAWRPRSTRTTADLHTLDWHAITDASAIMAAAEELKAFALEDSAPARVIARRALATTIGWPMTATTSALDRALDLLRWMTPAEAIEALGSGWPSDHEAGSSDPVLLQIDAVTAIYVPAHPHLHMLLRGIKPVRKSCASATQKDSPNAAVQSSATSANQVRVARSDGNQPERTATNVAHATAGAERS